MLHVHRVPPSTTTILLASHIVNLINTTDLYTKQLLRGALCGVSHRLSLQLYYVKFVKPQHTRARLILVDCSSSR